VLTGRTQNGVKNHWHATNRKVCRAPLYANPSTPLQAYLRQINIEIIENEVYGGTPTNGSNKISEFPPPPLFSCNPSHRHHTHHRGLWNGVHPPRFVGMQGRCTVYFSMALWCQSFRCSSFYRQSQTAAYVLGKATDTHMQVRLQACPLLMCPHRYQAGFVDCPARGKCFATSTPSLVLAASGQLSCSSRRL